MRRRWSATFGIAMVAAAALLPTGVASGSPARVAADPLASACQVSDNGRFADCESGYYSWIIRQANGEPLGTVDIAFTLSETVSPTSREWSAHWTVFVMNLTGVAQSGTTMAVVPECGGTCSAGTGLPDSGAVLTRNQTVVGDVAFSAPGTGRDTSTQTINIYLFNPAALGPGTTYGDPRTTLGPVRCDDGVPGEDRSQPPVPGCVVIDQTPTFVINSPEFSPAVAPVHAAFVASAQADPRTFGYGRPGSGRPLIRELLPTEAGKKAKRALGVCGRDFKRYSSPSGTAERSRDSCDEYPYQSTRQGVRPYAVAGHVPQGDNNDAGVRLGQFYQRYHIDDGDPFYVQP